MNSDEFRRHGKEMIDYIADYLDNIRDRRVFPDVQPGYIRELIPDHAPQDGEKWEDVFKDIERVIMPGLTHWQHPDFHAYYPSKNSYPSLLGELLSSGIGSVGFSWASSPACTELEVVVLDWLGKMLNLPEDFLISSGGPGGGVIQGTASESTLVALLSARFREILKYKKSHSDLDLEDGVIMSKFVAYCSDQSHTSVERAGLIAAIRMQVLPTDDNCSLRGQTLQDAIDEDKAKGLIPIFVCSTLGTTNSCAFDNVHELGIICEKEGIWMHIDAAYAGSAFVCPEFRHLLDGVQFAESFNFNPHKWLNVNFECSAMWVKNSNLLTGAYKVDSLFLKHEHQGKMPDFRDWQIPLGSRFRSLKLWFVLRAYGQKGLQECIRKDVVLAHEFEKLVKTDDRFEIFGEVVMGLVCFRLKGSSEINERLLQEINRDGRLHMVPASVKDFYILRFAICSNSTTSKDISIAWKVIQEVTEKTLDVNSEI